jgi:Alpha-N-acetylglucosaminidase (NAGLU) tim-barrel domain
VTVSDLVSPPTLNMSLMTSWTQDLSRIMLKYYTNPVWVFPTTTFMYDQSSQPWTQFAEVCSLESPYGFACNGHTPLCEDVWQAFLDGIPKENRLVLDVSGFSAPMWNQSSSFFGSNFLFCINVSPGGRPGMLGNLSQVLLHLSCFSLSLLLAHVVGFWCR